MKYLFICSILLLAACTPQEQYPPFEEEVSGLFDPSLKPFYHGVASGDPTNSAVVIWTRVTPEDSLPLVEVKWEISTDQTFSNVIQDGDFTTDPSRDYTVKIDVSGLESGFQYYYRFRALGATSVVGKTKTAPQDPTEVNLAVVSCSNYEFGYFNAYGDIASKTEIDAVVHLGDYIYEYGPGIYGDTTIGRLNLPAKEIITLQDYRTRYSLYRLDKDLRNAHTNHPFINIWDDHEIANDSYKDGAQNHQEEEGSYEARKNAAVQVYYEWLPIRENGDLYRSFKYGNLMELIMLDERLEGRTAPVDSLTDPSLADTDRSMLGGEQLSWLKEKLSKTTSTWKVIGNQVIFSYLNWGYEPNFTINLDSWDGYPAEQQEIANFIRSQEIDNVVFVTGDTHSSWAFEVSVDPFSDYNAESGEGAIAVEFGTTSINSSNSNERFDDEMVMAHEEKIVNSSINPHLKYANLRDHGYLLLNVTEEKAMASWYYVETLKEPNLATALGKELYVLNGETTLKE